MFVILGKSLFDFSEQLHYSLKFILYNLQIRSINFLSFNFIEFHAFHECLFYICCSKGEFGSPICTYWTFIAQYFDLYWKNRTFVIVVLLYYALLRPIGAISIIYSWTNLFFY